MQQASRIVAIILFPLMQFFAPLVHAHAGGGQFSGAIHVPGLEFLDVAIGTSAKAFNYEASSGVIVGVATGLRIQGDEANSAPDAAFDLPPNPLSDPGLPSGSVGVSLFCMLPYLAHFGLSLPPAPLLP